MIQFNLLPDVKLQYIKTQRSKRIVMVSSIVAAGVALAFFIILFLSVQVAQKKHLNDLSKDITTQVKTLSSTKGVNKILTIQNQLKSLPGLHADKPISSRLFAYISQITPALASISKLDMDLTLNTLTVTGSADSVVTVNKYADTLKFATYKSTKTDTGKPFSNVVTTINLTDAKASYVLTFNFDPILFSNSEVPVLTVPKIISTRSETEKPSAVFKEEPAPTTGGSK